MPRKIRITVELGRTEKKEVLKQSAGQHIKTFHLLFSSLISVFLSFRLVNTSYGQ